ncbi:hypothetical protein CIW49_21640 [Mycolicibacterium sp. P1-18]|uniref:hypothetical protein n=1 Tax=Mycolicibacterium sp. P1-18 TaxID=2024615 RepID=UPI0011F369AB|nr:hypothetical protein [Mycolicibacterium sp. P1-18]KAA0096121.1 hypothetical protein CIW49_21640 [Mycolicibacterium sp. P1-18]
MKFEARPQGWSGGPVVADVPAVAVLEVSGAVLEWTVDDPAGAAATRMTVTDVAAADWLWRVVGPAGHAALVSGAGVAEVDVRAEALEPLRRLAVGLWLRRWWPESSRDGIVRLDPSLLDAELALLVGEMQEFFTEDTLDSDVEGLLAPHRGALRTLEEGGDPRVLDVVRACVDLADDVGAWSAEVAGVPSVSVAGRRDDYALAAGVDPDRTTGAIATGVASVDWAAVPPRTFDAAEDTVEWSVHAADASVFAAVRVALVDGASAAGIVVRLRADGISATGVLDADGGSALPLTNERGDEITEMQAWDHGWSTATVTVGPDRPGAADAALLRQRVRDFARARLTRPGPDAFLAEILAAESDY